MRLQKDPGQSEFDNSVREKITQVRETEIVAKT
jgi:hypothetical protein